MAGCAMMHCEERPGQPHRVIASGGAGMARRDTGSHTKYWRSKSIPGMSLLRADLTAHQFGPHTHGAFVIAVTEAGGAEISSRGITEKVGPSTLFVSNPEECQSARMDEGERWLYRAFYLTLPAIDAVGRGLGAEAAPYFMQNMLNDIDLIDRFRSEAGGAEISSRGITEKVGPSTLFVSNPEECQSARMDEGERWLYRAFYLTLPAIDAVGRGLGAEAAPYFMQNMLNDIDLIDRF